MTGSNRSRIEPGSGRAAEAAAAAAEPLLERDHELGLLAARIQALRGDAPNGTCVLLCAEAGGGKTSLLAALAQRFERDVQWLWGTCEPMLSPPPLAALIDLLDRMPPSLAAAVRQGRHTPDVLAGMLELLRQRGRPTVLVIDDVQWADGATLELLRYLGRRIETTRALLVLSYRDDGLDRDHPLRALIGSLTARSCLRLQLAPLSAAAVAQLAARAGRDSRQSVRDLHQLTDGNPFFVAELLARHDAALPASVRDAVLARAAPLASEARDALELVSVNPAPLEFDVLDALIADAGAAVGACCAAGLLRLDGTLLRFRHELARRAIESSLPAGRGAALHAAVFDALDMRGAAPVRLVHHAAGAHLSGAVLALAPQAARAAAQAGAHRQAAQLYRIALEHAAGAPAAERATLLVAHADECMLVGRVDEAMNARQRALSLHRGLGRRLDEGLDLCALARIEWYRGAPLAGQPHARAAIDVLEPLDAPRELAMAYATLAQLHLLGETSAPAFEWGLKALAVFEGRAGALDEARADALGEAGDEARADALGEARADAPREPCIDAAGLAYALNTVGTAQLRSADAPQAWARLRRSLEIALAHGFAEPAARAYVNLVSLLLVHRRYAELEAPCAQGLAHCDANDLDLYHSRLRVRHAYALLESSRWSEAAAEIAEVRRMPALSELDDEQSLYVRHLIGLRCGHDDAHAYWTEMIAGRRALRIDPWFAPQAVARCEAAWLRGATDSVLRIATEAFAAAQRSEEGWRIGQLACWIVRAGGTAPAAALTLPAPCRLELAGDHRGAARAWAALGCRYEQALTLLGAGLAECHDAVALLDELGAAAAAALARRQLRAAGVRTVARGPNGRTRADPLGLTRRERQVLDLLHDRLTNREIAQRLHRSERTVEHHVAGLLAKLGAATRGEAAGLVQRPN